MKRIRAWRARLSGVRPRLALLCVMTTAPLTLLLLAGAVAGRNQAVGLAAGRARSLATLGAEQQAVVIRQAATLLQVLSQVPQVREAGAGCGALLRRVAADHPDVGTVFVIHADGSTACSSVGADDARGAAASAAAHPWFAQALAARTGGLIVAQPATGAAGQPEAVAVLPLPATHADGMHADEQAEGPDGQAGRRQPRPTPGGVLAAVLDTHWLDGPHHETGALVQVTDLRDGRLLAHTVTGRDGAGPGEAAGWPAQPEAALLAAARAARMDGSGGGSVDGTDAGGTRRVTGFAPLPGTDGNLVLSVGVPLGGLLSAALAKLALEVASAALATLCAVLAAVVIARRSLLQPLRRIVYVARRLGTGDLRARAGRLDGAVHELRLLGANLDSMGRRLRARSIELAAAQTDLRRSEEHYRMLSTYSSDMISRFDAALQLTYVSPACLDLTGYEPHELTGCPPGLVHPEDMGWVQDTLRAPLLAGEPSAHATYRIIRKDGAVVWMESIGRRLPGPDGAAGCVMVTRDVSARIEMERRLEDANRLLRGQAMQDPLTSLANRRHVDEALGTEFRRAQRLQLPMGILMLDIDRFKTFNDTYGHPAGDACLRAVAGAIAAVLRRPTDLAGRYGGEEFAVLLPDTDEAGVAATAERIRRGVQELGLTHAGSEFGIVTISVGGTVIMPQTGDLGPAAFVEAADAALYAAKRAGRNGLRLAAVSNTPAGPVTALQPDLPARPATLHPAAPRPATSCRAAALRAIAVPALRQDTARLLG